MEVDTACLRLRPEGVAKLGETAGLYCRRGL